MFEGESPLSEMVAYEAAKSMARDNIRPKLRAKTYPAHMKEYEYTTFDFKFLFFHIYY